MALSLSSQHPLVLRENTGQQGTQDTWPGPPTLAVSARASHLLDHAGILTCKTELILLISLASLEG